MVDRKEDELEKTYLWAFRDGTAADHAMVYSSWLQSNRAAPLYNLVPSNLYFKEYHNLIESVLDKGVVYVACDKEDPSQIFGYCVCEHDALTNDLTVHWVYVKHPFRNGGIAQSLMTHCKQKYPRAASVYFSTKTRRSGLNWDMVYNPFRLHRHVY